MDDLVVNASPEDAFVFYCRLLCCAVFARSSYFPDAGHCGKSDGEDKRVCAYDPISATLQCSDLVTTLDILTCDDQEVLDSVGVTHSAPYLPALNLWQDVREHLVNPLPQDSRLTVRSLTYCCRKPLILYRPSSMHVIQACY
jgi:hypothetical protein